MILTVNSEKELDDVASQILAFAGEERIFIFKGEMGAGKTTLIKSICQHLGSFDKGASPTYSLVNEYSTAAGELFHFDFFRIKDDTEALDMGFEEYLSSGNYCFIEWPEMVERFLPSHYVQVDIKAEGPDNRIIEVRAF